MKHILAIYSETRRNYRVAEYISGNLATCTCDKVVTNTAINYDIPIFMSVNNVMEEDTGFDLCLLHIMHTVSYELFRASESSSIKICLIAKKTNQWLSCPFRDKKTPKRFLAESSD
jgi:hypothetical protein